MCGLLDFLLYSVSFAEEMVGEINELFRIQICQSWRRSHFVGKNVINAEVDFPDRMSNLCKDNCVSTILDGSKRTQMPERTRIPPPRHLLLRAAGAQVLLVQDLDRRRPKGHQSLRSLPLACVPVPFNQDVNPPLVDVPRQADVIHLNFFVVVEVVDVPCNSLPPIHSPHPDVDEIVVVRRAEGEDVHFDLAAVVETENVLREVKNGLGVESAADESNLREGMPHDVAQNENLFRVPTKESKKSSASESSSALP